MTDTTSGPQPTQKLYRDDSYATTFEARVLEVNHNGDRLELRLDRTAFYPTAGGQPHDTGVLEVNAQVWRVVEVRESKGESVLTHVLEGDGEPKVGANVTGRIDWSRRFDLMQQHTGEHILGQAFFRLNAHVIAVNMESDVCTIDLAESVTDELAITAETIANEAVWDAHPITTYEVHDSEISGIPLRRTPKVSGMIRVVSIGDYDYSACGGTHLHNSSEVGIVKIYRLERVKGGATRVYFNCGRRALQDYRWKHAFVSGLGLRFSTALENVPSRTDAALEELAQVKRDLASMRTKYAGILAGSLEPQEPLGGVNYVTHVLEDASMLTDLAKAFAATQNTVGMLGARDGTRAMLAVACGPDANEHAGELLKIGLPLIEGRGGGKADVAQGSGTWPDRLEDALEAMLQSVRDR
jgi:alanyl-tRNA synthetase